MTPKQNLTHFPTLVQAPFIIVQIGDYTFGHEDKSGRKGYYNVTFPNFIQSLTVTKINGQVNQYDLQMTYAVAPGDDPNLLDHVFSNVAGTRYMEISYGDWQQPSNIYKKEKTIITNVQSDVNFSSSQIKYQIKGVSVGLELMSTVAYFPGCINKMSTELIDLVTSPQYGVGKAFKGMSNKQNILKNNLIPTDDIAVELQANPNCSVWDRINQIVNTMTFNDRSAVAGLAVRDDVNNDMGGSYFTVNKISSSAVGLQENVDPSYVVNVGYPENHFVTSFRLNDNEQWTILYKSAEDAGVSKQIQRLNTFGQLETTKSLGITRGNQLKTTQEDENWWKQVTSFPVMAQLEVKGLIRPIMLMNYLKINARFYGKKHISSGIYVISKQVDSISGSGYSTSLELIKIKGDDE